MKTGKTILTLTVLLMVAGIARADGRRQLSQDERSRFLVSAKAGKVSIAEGDVSHSRGKADWEIAIGGDDLANGDLLKTGTQSNAEILLNPGSYLRLAENTEIEFTDGSLDSIRFQLLKGSAIVEVSTVQNFEGAMATVGLPRAQFAITRGGIYRFDVLPDGSSRAAVRKGRMVMVGEAVLPNQKR